MEYNKKANWVQNPTKKIVTLYIVLTSIGSLLILLAITDFFSENPFKMKNALMFMLLIYPIWNCLKLMRNYANNTKD
jgi:multisubunit Na+/H+ antiporter MnhG subunit